MRIMHSEEVKLLLKGKYKWSTVHDQFEETCS
jgi:hypothetical protein